MNDLSKQQLILLALLISFVTSLATGIVTVSLMDQAPLGVTRTITQVIQQTVAGAVPTGASSTAAVSIAVSDQVAEATAAVVPSVVRLRDGDSGPVIALGLLVSPKGAIMTDKNVMDKLNAPEAVFQNGTAVPVSVARFQMGGEVAFLMPARDLSIALKPIAWGSEAKLGASVWSLSGTSTYALSQGIVDEVDPSGGNLPAAIHTTISDGGALPGTPLFDATGAIIGMETSSMTGGATRSFISVSSLQNDVP